MGKSKHKKAKPLRKASLPLMLIGWIAAWYRTKYFYKFKLDKSKMKGIKPPFIVFPNHLFTEDYYFVVHALRPYRANYVVAINQLIGREKLLKRLGLVPKRQFCRDLSLVRTIKGVVQRGRIFVVFPEAKFSTDGTLSVLPSSLGKLVKQLGVTVVHINMHGNFVGCPFYDSRERLRNVPHTAEMYPMLTAQQISQMTAEDIQQTIVSKMQYDDYQWQRDNNVQITEPFNAEGLHNLLYICPNCLSQCKTTSKGVTLSCTNCGSEWTLNPDNTLTCNNGTTHYDNIPKWNAWQRQVIRQEILDGKYMFHDQVDLWLMNGFKGYKRVGEGEVTHDLNGVTYQGTMDNAEITLNFPPLSTYTCAFRIGGDFDISTETQTYFFFPKNHSQQMTKLCIAMEEMYELKKQGKL